MDFAEEIAGYDKECRVDRWRSPIGLVTYRTLGDGPGLVVIPGIASTYRGYAAILNRLSENFRTIVFDYPGDNAGDQSDLSRIDHNDLVRNVTGLCDHLELNRPALYGPSFGSTLLIGAHSANPDRFGRSVIQGGFVRRNLGALERLAFGLGRKVPGTLGRLPFRELMLGRTNKRYFKDRIRNGWPIYLAQNGLTPIASFSQRLDLVSRIDLREAARNVRSDILLIHSEGDRVIGEAPFQELKEALKGRATEVRLKEEGHQPHFTCPETLAALIREWVLHGKVASS